MMIVKKIDALSLAKIQGLTGVFVGLIAGIIIGIASSIMNSLLKASTGGSDIGVMTFGGLGWIAVIILPLVYGLAFFLGGLIFAGIYNLVARMVGGMKMDIEFEQVNSGNVQPQMQQPIRK